MTGEWPEPDVLGVGGWSCPCGFYTATVRSTSPNVTLTEMCPHCLTVVDIMPTLEPRDDG